MKYLGIDYGTKRIGIAISDDNGEFAFPKAILANTHGILDKMKDMVEEENVQGMVIGESRATNEVINEVGKEIEFFKRSLEAIGVPIFFEREGFSSVEAYRYQQGKGPADDRAAAIILQRFLDKNKK